MTAQSTDDVSDQKQPCNLSMGEGGGSRVLRMDTHRHIVCVVLAQCCWLPCGEWLIVRLLIAFLTVEPEWEPWLSSERREPHLQALTLFFCEHITLHACFVLLLSVWHFTVASMEPHIGHSLFTTVVSVLNRGLAIYLKPVRVSNFTFFDLWEWAEGALLVAQYKSNLLYC